MKGQSGNIEKLPSKVVGQRIKFLRRDRGLSGVKLGLLLGLSQQHISRIENGNTKINIEQLNMITEALSIPLYYLLQDIGYQPKNLYAPAKCKTVLQATSLIDIL
ncbi:helix-turn-helix domain-containing protein [Providencia rettgeri]|uniref:helix-turn-helix domain-containing protein n=1 Tax=Providencia rettgeri TaxID=587 RepID=UPI00029BB3C4|nr:helix-turn-helix transcriptional regulator [Providencia rettgeri]EKT60439.1 fimbrial operon regulator [Providencia rettgeri Dmel1]